MRTKFWKAAIAATALAGFATTALADTPKSGGTLDFVVGSKIPSYDAHVETTFGMIHPIAPFYSLLIRVDPSDPNSGEYQCDVCESFEGSEDGLTWTYKIRKGLTFHDGKPLDANDVYATYEKIINPPEGIASSRKAFYAMVESHRVVDDHTYEMKLKFPSGAYLPSMASPFNFIYADEDLKEHGLTWHKTNVNGSGPFKFVEHQPGAFVSGVKNENYHHEGQAPTWMASRHCRLRNWPPVCRPSKGIALRSSSAASRRNSVTLWSTRSVTRLSCRKATGTACCW